MNELFQYAKAIKLLVLDVDGVLTDGCLYFGNQGEQLKVFNVQDGLGIKLLQKTGVEVAIITARQSKAVEMRAKGLGICHLMQGREDKLPALDELCANLSLEYRQVAYLGDDLPDLAAIRRVALGMTVANGHHLIVQHAHWQSQCKGGNGAVREACEFIMAAQGNLEKAFDHYL